MKYLPLLMLLFLCSCGPHTVKEQEAAKQPSKATPTCVAGTKNCP
jgi:hypothetical protein